MQSREPRSVAAMACCVARTALLCDESKTPTTPDLLGERLASPAYQGTGLRALVCAVSRAGASSIDRTVPTIVLVARSGAGTQGAGDTCIGAIAVFDACGVDPVGGLSARLPRR
jgi:sugar/nucleoside kinase (ribokinase family)